MISAMSTPARRFVAHCSGSAAVEYGIVTLIAVAVMLAVNAIGGDLNAIFGKIAAAFNY